MPCPCSCGTYCIAPQQRVVRELLDYVQPQQSVVAKPAGKFAFAQRMKQDESKSPPHQLDFGWGGGWMREINILYARRLGRGVAFP